MRDTKKKGDISEAKILAALLAQGKVVLLPFGDNQRYDLVIDEGGKFIRVQCKTGRLRNGAIIADFRSISSNGQNVRNYKGQVDYYAIYCFETDSCYLLPMEETVAFTLRVEEPKPGVDMNRIRWAKDFKIG